MIRRLLIPVLLIAVAVGAAVQARRTDDASDPGRAVDVGAPESVVGTPLLSVRRTPEWLRQPLADQLLEDEVRSAARLSVTPPATCVVAHRDGETLVNIQGSVPLVPASGQKILTAAAIYELAPADDVFRTEVVNRLDAAITPTEEAEGEEERGDIFEGDLWLIGGGDPVLSTPDYINRFDEPRAFTDFTELADSVAAELAALGVTEINGAIIADESRYLPAERDYTEEPVEDGQIWKEEFRTTNQAGPLSALLLNDGYTSWPEDPQLRSENTRADDPAVAAAETLRTLLAERGITVRGASTNDIAPPLSERASLAEIVSPPLGDIVTRMLLHSDNTTAEMLLKEIGLRSGVGSPRGFAVLGMQGTLRDAGYPVSGTQLADGSGLSSFNHANCALLVEILDTAGPGSPLVEGLAVVGESGTLRACLANITAFEDVSGKTGTLNDVTALAGMTVADNGDVITFAMIANGESVGAELGTCNTIQTTLIRAVAGHPYGPELTDLEPLVSVSG